MGWEKWHLWDIHRIWPSEATEGVQESPVKDAESGKWGTSEDKWGEKDETWG